MGNKIKMEALQKEATFSVGKKTIASIRYATAHRVSRLGIDILKKLLPLNYNKKFQYSH